MLESSLIQLGFTKAEAKIYLLLLEFTDLKAGDIAKKSQLPRATVYSALDKLIEYGLISVSLHGTIKSFSMEPVNNLSELLNKREEKIKNQQRVLAEILPELEKNQKQLLRPEVTFYEGPQSVKSLFKNIAANNKDIYLIGDWQDLITDSQTHITERLKHANKMTMITRDTPLARKQKKEDKKVLRRQFLVDQSSEMPATVSVGENHLAIYTLDPGFPIGIRIRNKKIIKTVLTLFKLAIKGVKNKDV